MDRSLGRSVLAVVVGFVLIGALALAGDSLVFQLRPEAYDAQRRLLSVPLLVLTQAYVGVFAVLGCYVCARLAPHHPLRHAMILGGLGLAFNVAGSLQRWDELPLWYHLVGLGLTLPWAYVGGRLRERELARTQPDAVAVAA